MERVECEQVDVAVSGFNREHIREEPFNGHVSGNVASSFWDITMLGGTDFAFSGGYVQRLIAYIYKPTLLPVDFVVFSPLDKSSTMGVHQVIDTVNSGGL